MPWFHDCSKSVSCSWIFGSCPFSPFWALIFGTLGGLTIVQNRCVCAQCTHYALAFFLNARALEMCFLLLELVCGTEIRISGRQLFRVSDHSEEDTWASCSANIGRKRC